MEPFFFMVFYCLLKNFAYFLFMFTISFFPVKAAITIDNLFFVLLALRDGQSWPQAMQQLSFLRFSHYPKAKSAAITYPLYDFAGYADQEQWPRDLEHFRKWLSTDHARQAHQNWLQRRKD